MQNDFYKIIELPFLGQRSYLHGTTLFDALIHFLEIEGTGLHFKIMHMIHSPHIEVILIDPKQHLDSGVNAVLRTDQYSLAVKEHLVQNFQPTRLEHNESGVVDRAIFSDSKVSLSGESEFSAIATIVALNKALLLKTVRNDKSGQWVFTGLDLPRIPSPHSQFFSVQTQSVLGRGQLVKSSVMIDDQQGTLYFSWINR